MSYLIKRHTNYDMTSLTDALSCIAANIEDAYIQSGAVARRDYTYNDLMSLAMKLICDKKLSISFFTDTTIHGEQ